MEASIITTADVWLFVRLSNHRWKVFAYRDGKMDEGRSADEDCGEEKGLQHILSALLHNVEETGEVVILVPKDCAERFTSVWTKLGLPQTKSTAVIRCRQTSSSGGE